MRRYVQLLSNEFKLFRTTIPVHLIAIFQPTVMYLLMTVILVHPTFDMYVTQPNTAEGWALVAAMKQVGSPIGAPYIRPVLVNEGEAVGMRQIVVVEKRGGALTAVQRYGLIDSNIVKNYRNRLTAAALHMWEEDLGPGAVAIEEHPWLPRDIPYAVYFGMAMLPMTTALAASIIGGMLTAQEFEFDTILEYHLAPVSPALILGARLTRLTLTGLISAGVLMIATGLVTDAWPSSIWRAALILLPVALIAGCLGISAGLIIKISIPAFLVGLVTSFVGWILGSAFGLAAHFGGGYEFVSRLTPNTHAVELLFPLYFGAEFGKPTMAALILAAMSLVMLALVTQVYQRQVGAKE